MPTLAILKAKAVRSLAALFDDVEPAHLFVPGTLGDVTGTVDVPGRPGYVYVRLLGDPLRTVRARNMGIQSTADASVQVEMTGNPSDRVPYRLPALDNIGRTYSDSFHIGNATDYLAINAPGVVTLYGTAKRGLTLRPEINIDEIKKQAVPDQIAVGVFFAYSMPIWNSDHEELYFKQNVPGRWDGSSDITVHIATALSNVEDVGDKFKFQLSWNFVNDADDVIPVTTHDVTVEQTVLLDRSAQYNVYELEFTIDYDADGLGAEIQPHSTLSIRLRRVAATSLEVSNEILILDCHDLYQVDKMFKAL